MNDYIALQDVLTYMMIGFAAMQTGVTLAVLAAAARPSPDLDLDPESRG